MASPKAAAPLAHLALPGAVIEIRAHPGARRNQLTVAPDGGIRVEVTTAPEDGKANTAIARLLAKALDLAPSRLELTHGATARSKRFRIRD